MIWFVDSQQAKDVNIMLGWRWTWHQTDVSLWLRMKIGLLILFDTNLQPKFNQISMSYVVCLLGLLFWKKKQEAPPLTPPLNLIISGEIAWKHKCYCSNSYTLTANLPKYAIVIRITCGPSIFSIGSNWNGLKLLRFSGHFLHDKQFWFLCWVDTWCPK